MQGEVYSYQMITDVTERTLNKYVAEAIDCPEKTKMLHTAFNAAFWLWFELTRESQDSNRDADGTRFMDLILKFSEQ